MNKEMIEFKNAKFWTDDSEILYCKFNNEDSSSQLGYALTSLYIKAITKLCNGKPMPFLIDVQDTRGTFSISAAKLIADNSELNKLRISEAFVVNSIATRLLIKTYKRIFNPDTPFGLFTDIKTGKAYSFETKNNFYYR